MQCETLEQFQTSGLPSVALLLLYSYNMHYTLWLILLLPKSFLRAPEDLYGSLRRIKVLIRKGKWQRSEPATGTLCNNWVISKLKGYEGTLSPYRADFRLRWVQDGACRFLFPRAARVSLRGGTDAVGRSLHGRPPAHGQAHVPPPGPSLGHLR